MKTGTGMVTVQPADSGLKDIKEAAENDSQVTEDMAKKA